MRLVKLASACDVWVTQEVVRKIGFHSAIPAAWKIGYVPKILEVTLGQSASRRGCWRRRRIFLCTALIDYEEHGTIRRSLVPPGAREFFQ